MRIRIVPEIARDLTHEAYAPEPEITGVRFAPLRKHRALEGWFMEHLRLDGGEATGLPFALTVRQVSFSHAVAGRINAFHLHVREAQAELWCVLEGSLLVWLVDVREGSPSLGARQRRFMSGEEPGLLLVPAGVAHGYRAGPDGALLAYAANRQFQPEEPDEGRLPWDYFGRELWEDDRG